MSDEKLDELADHWDEKATELVEESSHNDMYGYIVCLLSAGMIADLRCLSETGKLPEEVDMDGEEMVERFAPDYAEMKEEREEKLEYFD